MKNLPPILFLLFTCSLTNAQYQTRGEIFDYQVDDEFHYEWIPGEDYASGVKRRFILAREDFPDQDSVRYTERIESYKQIATFFDPPFVEYYDVDTFSYGLGNLSSEIIPWICNDTLPPGACYASDTLLENSFCGKDVAIFEIISGVPYFEYERDKAKFAKGLGRFFDEDRSDSAGNYMESTEMIYYKKGDDECGTPDYSLVSISITPFDPKISITPNPSTGVFYLDISHNRTESIHVFNVYGGKVFEASTDISVIDLSKLNAGVYYVIIQGEGFYSSKKIIKM